jgi:hypothetical protein
VAAAGIPNRAILIPSPLADGFKTAWPASADCWLQRTAASIARAARFLLVRDWSPVLGTAIVLQNTQNRAQKSSIVDTLRTRVETI